MSEDLRLTQGGAVLEITTSRNPDHGFAITLFEHGEGVVFPLDDEEAQQIIAALEWELMRRW